MKNIKQTVFVSIILTVLTGLNCSPAYSQLQIGDVLPAHRFEELKRTSSADFPKSAEPVRLYILDFWSRWCGSCIVSFPKVEGLQYRYKDDIKIIAINPWNDDEEVLELFDTYNSYSVNREELKQSNDNSWNGSEFKPRMTTLPALNGDKSWLDMFEIKGVPHHIWINSRGQVIAVTNPYDVNAGNIEYYLRTGVLPNLAFKPSIPSYRLENNSLTELWGKDAFPYQQNGLKIRDFYRGDGATVFGYERLGVVDSVKKTIRYSFVNTSIADMYKIAWAMADPGHYRPLFSNGFFGVMNGDTMKYVDVLNERLLWEVSIPEYFIGPVNRHYVTPETPGYNEWSLRAKFCAELELPLERQEEAASILLSGLNQYFNKKFGISARIKSEKRYCLVLKKKREFNLHVNSSDKATYSYDPEGKVESYLNHPFSIIFYDYIPYRIDHSDRDKYWFTNSWGNHYMPRFTRNFPFLDETGVIGNVDIVLHDVPDHISDPVEALNIRLKGTGLYVEKEVRDIDMLVISDRQIQAE